MERREIDMLGSDELVACLCSHVFDVIDEEGVSKWLLDKEDNLCAARRQFFNNFSAYTGCSALLRRQNVIF